MTGFWGDLALVVVPVVMTSGISGCAWAVLRFARWSRGLGLRLDQQDAALGAIQHEVQYNGSTSMKDALRRTEQSCSRIEGVVAVVQAKLIAADHQQQSDIAVLRVDLRKQTDRIDNHLQGGPRA